jgi:cytochrome P450
MIIPIVIAIVVGLYIYHLYNMSPLQHIPGHRQFLPRWFPVIPWLNPYPFRLRFNAIDIELKRSLNLQVGVIKQCYGLTGSRILISDANLLKEILLSNPKKYTKPNERYNIFEDYGPNILTLNGEPWRRQRKLCDPAFGPNNLRLLTHVTNVSTIAEMKSWEDGLVLDIDASMSSITLDIISKAGFGYDIKKIKQPNNMRPFRDVIRDAISGKVLITKVLVPETVRRVFEYMPFDNFALNVKKIAADLEVYLKMIVEYRKKATEESYDLLSLLLTMDDENSEMNEMEIISNSFIFLLAGHDTTSCQLAWTLYELSNHQSMQERLYQENVKILGDREATMEDYEKMTFTNNVIRESLRLHPPVHGILKTNVEKVNLGGFELQPDTNLLLNIYSVQRDERYWKNALTFDPDRWDHDEKIVTCSYLPFSTAERKCIGWQFSLVESCVILTQIMKNFTVHNKNPSKEEPKCAMGIVAKPLGLELYFKKRK